MSLLLTQIKYMNCYSNEVRNQQTESVVRDSNRLWCNEHGVYEDECLICNPESVTKAEELSQNLNRLWCNEHGVYEDECFICHPELKLNKSKLPSVELYCEEHRVPEQECGICHPELTALLIPGEGLKVRLKSLESAVKAGVITIAPDEDKSPATHSVLCQVTYNMNYLARITPLTSGVIRKVLVDVGAFVSKDDVLVEIVSSEIASAKVDYLTAIANQTLKGQIYKRTKGLFEKKISSQREYQQVLAEYQVATNTTNTRRQQLLNYGFTEVEVKEIVETQLSTSVAPIRAPFAGTIIERNAVIGEAVGPGDTLFSLADLSTMWLELSIPEYLLSSFKVGDTVEASFNSLPGTKLHGDLIWLASYIEEESRMLKARAIIKNPDSFLKHGLFGQVSLLSEQCNKVFYVPVESIQRFNEKSFLFVKLSDDLFEIRRVVLGSRNDDKIEIIEGISLHEKVVVTGSFTLKSEFLKSRLGEGCVDE
ncbi:MAG: efflux RND transporter periplasmic adaptor subunit [Planctomycetes bacterium]|nr:efflux RND transporter periplasmic adaptor subunit [Planctomycetota bacterium]